MSGYGTQTPRCGGCRHYAAHHCLRYDETTKPESVVRCVGYEPRQAAADDCASCCYMEDGHCEFYERPMCGVTGCEAWEPVIEM